MSFGLDANGFSIKSLAQIETELDALFRAAYGAGIKTTPDTQFGKQISTWADREASLWELAEAVYNAFYPNSSSDISLARIGEITAISPNPAPAKIITTAKISTSFIVNSFLPSSRKTLKPLFTQKQRK